MFTEKVFLQFCEILTPKISLSKGKLGPSFASDKSLTNAKCCGVQIFIEFMFSCCGEIPCFVSGAFIKLYYTQHIAKAPVIGKLFSPGEKK